MQRQDFKDKYMLMLVDSVKNQDILNDDASHHLNSQTSASFECEMRNSRVHVSDIDCFVINKI